MEEQLQQIKHFINYSIKYRLQHKSFWLFATLSSLATLHFYYLWKISGKIPLLTDILVWGTMFFLLWQKRNRIKFTGNLIASIIGIILICWMILRHTLSQFYSSSSKLDVLSGFFPFIILIGLLLILTGFKKLINYKIEIFVSLIATIMSLPLGVVFGKLTIVPRIDAQITAFILHYIGFTVSRENAIVALPNGSIAIAGGCSSIAPLTTILPIMVMFLLIYPTSRIKKILVGIGAIFSIFFMNAIRLSLLAILVNKFDEASFEYWHGGEGAGIFSHLIVFLIAGISYQILNPSSSPTPKDLDIESE